MLLFVFCLENGVACDYEELKRPSVMLWNHFRVVSKFGWLKNQTGVEKIQNLQIWE